MEMSTALPTITLSRLARFALTDTAMSHFFLLVLNSRIRSGPATWYGCDFTSRNSAFSNSTGAAFELSVAVAASPLAEFAS